MTINFITKGKNNPTQIYVRLKDKSTNVDATAGTGFSVMRSNFNKKIIFDSQKNADAKTKSKLADSNADLLKIDTALTDLRKTILTAFNNRKEYETVNAKWIKNIINPKNENTNVIPNELVKYFDLYLLQKKDSLKGSTIKKLKVIQNRLINFESDTNVTTYLQEVNKDFVQRFKNWSDNTAKYHKNTFIKTIKVLVTVCNYAEFEHDITLHPQTHKITKGLKYDKTPHVFLSFAELQKIENKKIDITDLDLARDWLLISCYTAQRVSDFMSFSTNDIVNIEGSKFLDITQGKTEKPVLVYLNEIVLNIMGKYNNEFPPLFNNNSKDHNEIIYNRLVKKVCKVCKIDNEISSQIKNDVTNRAEIKTLPKYKFISSHIGRRSYATNYYGQINTALLIGATGHSTEKQFLEYVGSKPTQDATALAKAMRKLTKDNSAPMKIIKNASNQN